MTVERSNSSYGRWSVRVSPTDIRFFWRKQEAKAFACGGDVGLAQAANAAALSFNQPAQPTESVGKMPVAPDFPPFTRQQVLDRHAAEYAAGLTKMTLDRWLLDEVNALELELMGWRAARAFLDTIAALPQNWDSYGARPVDPRAIALARIMTIRPASIVPTSGGGIQLEWHEDGLHAEVVIHPDGSI